MKRYLPRIYDRVLKERLEAKGAVLVEGPKWCGKTTTCQQTAKSEVMMQDPRTHDQNARLAQISPGVLLSGAVPRLVDEWQVAPSLWDAVRFEVDERDDFGQFILTGSAVPADLSRTEHTGTGRIARMRMRTMSLSESGESTGEVSLSALLAGTEVPVAQAEDGLEEIAFLTCRGGWPKTVGAGERVALRQAFDYVDALAEVDISRVDGVRRSPFAARMLMRSYARMTSSQGTLANMRADMERDGAPLGETAFLEYVEALRRLFVLEDLPAWSPNLRSKTAMRTSPTRHFADPSIAVAALGAGPGDLMADLETFGLLFEDLCVRDLRVYSDALGGEVMHYRDKTGLECDAVVRTRNGSYGLVEVKLGGSTLIDEGAKSLRKLARLIEAHGMAAPAFLMVLTATGGFSYPREDGVLVVPVRTLGA